MLSLRRFGMAQQTLIGVALLCLLVVTAFFVFLSSFSRSLSISESNRTLETQTKLISITVNYARGEMLQEALTVLNDFLLAMPEQTPHLTGRSISVNGRTRPESMFGNVATISNQAYLESYQKTLVSGASFAFLGVDGNKLFRATTLLKDAAGHYRDGEDVSDDYAEKTLAGETHVGVIVRNGQIFALAAMPVKDAGDRIVGVVTARLPVDKQLKDLRGHLQDLVIGETGYAFIMQEAVGDQKDAFFIVHKIHAGKLIKDMDDDLRPALEKALEEKNGFHDYHIRLDDGSKQTKLMAFGEIPELNWIVAASVPQEEFTASYDQIRNWTMLGLACMIAVLMFCLFFFIRWQLRPLAEAQATVSVIAENLDLTLSFNDREKDEIGAIARSLNQMTKNFRETLRLIADQVNQVGVTVESVNTAASQVAESSVSQANSASAMASSIEEMTVSINTVATNASDAQSMAQKAGEISNDGIHIIGKTRSEMGDIARAVAEASGVIGALGEESRQIGGVVNLIKEIADQTNLLALNAAIEAARAGEAGRGFAVVADEVRKLAERTTQSTSEIGAITTRIQQSAVDAVNEMNEVVKRVESGEHMASEASDRMQVISQEANKVFQVVTEISNALQEQSQASHEVSRHVDNIAQMTDENNAAAEETASNAKRLESLSGEVKKALGQFKT